MDEISYATVSELLEGDYYDFIHEESYTNEQAIAAVLEDSVIMMKTNYHNYVSVIIASTKLCLENNKIPRYILNRFMDLSDTMLEHYPYKKTQKYITHMAYIHDRLETKDFYVKDDAYEYRLHMLLEAIT